jgi:uncharacterized protein YozE (UPF0346 family)
MNKSTPTPVSLNQLRRDAKRRSRDKGIPLHEAQNQLAIERGFQNWSILARNTEQAARAAQFVASVTTVKPLAPPRYYLHGDVSEHDSNSCYCAQCDIFTSADHFSREHGREKTLERYLTDVLSWNEWHKYPEDINCVRPENAKNVLAIAAQVYVATREKARSGFHRWLDEQKHRDDPVGDLARDILSDRDFPVSECSFDVLSDYLHRRSADAGAFDALRDAFCEYDLF